MPQEPGESPKIIVDDDWKSQAQAEKERLAQQEASKAPTSPRSDGSAAGASGSPGGQGELPPADFASLVGMLATQALMYLGGVADRKTGAAIFDPEMSRFYIDLLACLEDKTKGNLSDAEARDLSGAVHELRLRFVELSQAVSRQSAQGSPDALRAAGGQGPLRVE